MSKIAFTDKVDSVTNPNPAINKVTAGNMNEIKVSVNDLYDSIGWINYRDTVHTVSNKQALTAGIDNTITIVDADPIDSYKPVVIGSNELWQGNKITPHAIGDFYNVRFYFKASISNPNGYFEIKIDIDGAVGNVFNSVELFPKGGNITHAFSRSIALYSLDTFVANGGNIFINPSHSMDIWDKGIVISRTMGGDLF